MSSAIKQIRKPGPGNGIKTIPSAKSGKPMAAIMALRINFTVRFMVGIVNQPLHNAERKIYIYLGKKVSTEARVISRKSCWPTWALKTPLTLV